jgi:hypothetical protein
MFKLVLITIFAAIFISKQDTLKERFNIVIEKSEILNTSVISLYDYSTFKASDINFFLLPNLSHSNITTLPLTLIKNLNISDRVAIPMINNYDECLEYNLDKFIVKNCTFLIRSLKYGIDLYFDLLQFSNRVNKNTSNVNSLLMVTNNTNYENAIEFRYPQQNLSIGEFYVFPQFASSYFKFEECYYHLCSPYNSSQINLNTYIMNDDYNFKIHIDNEVNRTSELLLIQAVLILNTDNKIEYMKDIQRILINANNTGTYSLPLEGLPDNFDLHLTFLIRGKNQNEKILNDNDIVTMVKRNIQIPLSFDFDSNPNTKYVWVLIALISSLFLITGIILFYKCLIITIKQKKH